MISLFTVAPPVRDTFTRIISDIFELPRYPQTTFVEVFGSSRRVFDLLAEDERQLEQEEVAVPPLPDQRLRLPNQEGVLEQELPLDLQALLQT